MFSLARIALTLAHFTAFAACTAPTSSNNTDAAAPDIASPTALALADNSLNAAQSNWVLTLLGDTCRDSWCELDDSVQFRSIACDYRKGSCTLAIRVGTPARDGGRSHHYLRTCTVPDIANYTDLIETAPNGFQSLTPALFEKVNGCVLRIESDVDTVSVAIPDAGATPPRP